MRVVFDKESAISFFRQLDDHPNGKDILNLLKKQLDLCFNFQLDEIDEYLEDQILEFHETGGRTDDGLSITHRNFQERAEDFCVQNIENNNDIYLVKNASDKVKNANKVFIASEGEEFEVLIKLFPDVRELQMHEERVIGGPAFKDWAGIKPFVRPFSSMVIVDRFMFSGSNTEGNNYTLFDYNLKEFLGWMYEHQTLKTDLTFIYRIDPYNRNPLYKDEGPDLSELKSKIKAACKSRNRNCPEPRINLIAVPKDKIDDDHDRNIITDYMRIKSGDTFIYFDSNNRKITDGNDIDIYSLARRTYRNSAASLVSKFKQITKENLSQFGPRCLLFESDNPDKIIPL